MRLRRLLLRIVPILLFSALAPSKRIGEFRNFADKSSGGSSVLFFLSLFFFLLSRTKGKRVKTCCAYAWLARIRRGQSWFERTNAYEVCPVSQKNVFEDFTGESKHQSERWVVLFDPPIIIRTPSIGSKLDFSSIFETTFERESFHGEKIVFLSRRSLGDAVWNWNVYFTVTSRTSYFGDDALASMVIRMNRRIFQRTRSSWQSCGIYESFRKRPLGLRVSRYFRISRTWLRSKFVRFQLYRVFTIFPTILKKRYHMYFFWRFVDI